MSRPLFVCVLCCSIGAAALAQDYRSTQPKTQPPNASVGNHRSLQGSVQDAQTGEPLAYAHISLAHRHLGTYSNDAGSFVLKYMPQERDTLVLHYIGYHSLRLPLHDSLWQQPRSYKLEPSDVVMDPVVIQPVATLPLMQRIVQRLPENYAAREMLIRGFFRESSWDSTHLCSLAEGVLDVIKVPYTDARRDDQVHIVKSRKDSLPDYTFAVGRDSAVLFGTTAGAYVAISRDVLRAAENYLDPHYFKHYVYTLREITQLGTDEVYVIECKPRDGTSRAYYTAQLYVHTNNLAVLRINYQLVAAGLRRQLMNESEFPLLAEWGTVEYGPIESRYVLQRVHAVKQYGYKRTTKRFTVQAEFIATETHPAQRRFAPDEALDYDEVFVHQVGPPDEAFWQHYNTLQRHRLPPRAAPALR